MANSDQTTPPIGDDGYRNVKPIRTADDPALDPYELEFRPEFRQGRGPQGPFVNEHGVVIGDRDYESEHSPLEQWTSDTDPAVMAGEQWVHPFKDVGFQATENREYFEEGIQPGQTGARFSHPDKNVAYGTYNGTADEAENGEKKQH